MKRCLFVAFLAIFCIVSLAWAGSQGTSSTLASTIITNARYILREATAAMWTDAELLVWINEGVHDIVTATLCLQTDEQVTLATNTLAYSLSETYIDIAGAIYYDSTNTIYKGLKPGNLMHVGNYGEEGGPPAFYVEWKDQILLYPLAGSTTSGEQVTVYLFDRPTAITATSDTIPTPAHYDHLLPLYVAARALQKDGHTGRASQLMTEYNAKLDRWRADLNTDPQGDVE
jgi:hypothetical protein